MPTPLEEDVAEVKRWTERHEERHSDDSRMLALILEQSAAAVKHIEEHLKNHHSRLSTIKQSGAIGAALAMLGAVAELLRRLLL